MSASKEAGRERMCRAIVRPKKQVQVQMQRGRGTVAGALLGASASAERFAAGEGGQASLAMVEVEVLNIWEAGWDDVEYVRGIVAA